MIGKLTGQIDSVEDNMLILDVNGVGYLVFASPRTLSSVPAKGEVCTLFIDTHVREDHFHLYGFIDKAEQSWFRLLTTVQGVGAKVALALFGVAAPDKLQVAIMAQDKAVITLADGVGPKLATRILSELKDKVGTLSTSDFTPQAGSSTQGAAVNIAQGDCSENAKLDEDAVSALINLGYGRADAFSAVMRVRANDNASGDLQGIIKQALKELSS